MRLIDADELKKNYTASFVNAFGMEEAEMFVGVINQMPTAYDIDKVVEQLEDANATDDFIQAINGKECNKREKIVCGVALEYAIEIVKGGVK